MHTLRRKLAQLRRSDLLFFSMVFATFLGLFSGIYAIYVTYPRATLLFYSDCAPSLRGVGSGLTLSARNTAGEIHEVKELFSCRLRLWNSGTVAIGADAVIEHPQIWTDGGQIFATSLITHGAVIGRHIEIDGLEPDRNIIGEDVPLGKLVLYDGIRIVSLYPNAGFEFRSLSESDTGFSVSGSYLGPLGRSYSIKEHFRPLQFLIRNFLAVTGFIYVCSVIPLLYLHAKYAPVVAKSWKARILRPELVDVFIPPLGLTGAAWLFIFLSAGIWEHIFGVPF